MQPIIEDIIQRFAKYPWAEYEHTDDSITYLPANDDGFRVRLVVLKNRNLFPYSVCFNGLHEGFSNEASAILHFAYGLSNGCRLKEYSRQSQPYRWVLEIDGSHGWTPNWETFDFTKPECWRFWEKPSVQTLQNNLIDI